MSKSSELAGLVARLAISALVSPQAVLSEAAKYGQSRYEDEEQRRQILRRVTQAVGAWAAGEQLTAKEVELGLQLAADTVKRHGLGNDGLAALDFNPARVAEVVVTSAKNDDPYWGTESYHTVAERGIGVTYEALIAQLRNSESVVIPAFLALRNSLDDHGKRAIASADAAAGGLSALTESIAATATADEVMSYLRVRMADWDVLGWQPDRNSSAVERPLGLRERESGQSIGHAEALDCVQSLVVLGGPGSGKTFLARRYAREAARMALSRLERGAGLDDVELPLLTTWSEWSTTPGSPMQSLVASSFASGHGLSDVGGLGAVDRLQRTFLQPTARILLIVDSLDEAADITAQGGRIRDLGGLPSSWRCVVTSRPAAWESVYRRGAGSFDPRVMDLNDLGYPGDVDDFVRAWFANSANPDRGDSLIREIHTRDVVARAAVVPLISTFYCLLADGPWSGTDPLPARRRDLYRRLVRRMLRGAWTANHPGPDAAPDLDLCEQVLTSWAWAAVCNRNDAAGLGNWTDSFAQSKRPRNFGKAEWRAIDHIAPKIEEDDEGNVVRRFVHRTFLEHFVAEHVATLKTSEATNILLPHLWFDPDWQLAAPAAIIAHNQRRPGALLKRILDWAPNTAMGRTRHIARSEFDRLILTLARDSEPNEWSQRDREFLHKLREEASMPDLVAASVHWKDSNPQVRNKTLRFMSALEGWSIRQNAKMLLTLSSTFGERAEVRASLLRSLSVHNGNPATPRALAEALLTLAPTADEVVSVRRQVLCAMASTERSEKICGLAVGLPVLWPSVEERAWARGRIVWALDHLGAGQYYLRKSLWQALCSLALTADEQTEVWALPQLVIRNEHLRQYYGLARLLVGVDGDNRRIDALSKSLSKTEFMGDRSGQALAQVAQDLAPTAHQRSVGRARLLTALTPSQPAPKNVLIGLLQEFASTAEERAEVRLQLLRAMVTARAWELDTLREAIAALTPTIEEWADVRLRVLHALDVVDNRRQVRTLANRLLVLAPIHDNESGALSQLHRNVAATTDLAYVRGLTKRLLIDARTADEPGEIRVRVMQALAASGDPQAVYVMTRSLPVQAFAVDESAEARAQVFEALGDPHNLSELNSFEQSLPTAASDLEEEAQAREVVLQALSTADDPAEVSTLVNTLLVLSPAGGGQREARAAVLRALSSIDSSRYEYDWNDPDEVEDMKFMAYIEWSLVRALRRFSTSDSWLAWISNSKADADSGCIS